MESDLSSIKRICIDFVGDTDSEVEEFADKTREYLAKSSITEYYIKYRKGNLDAIVEASHIIDELNEQQILYPHVKKFYPCSYEDISKAINVFPNLDTIYISFASFSTLLKSKEWWEENHQGFINSLRLAVIKEISIVFVDDATLGSMERHLNLIPASVRSRTRIIPSDEIHLGL